MENLLSFDNIVNFLISTLANAAWGIVGYIVYVFPHLIKKLVFIDRIRISAPLHIRILISLSCIFVAGYIFSEHMGASHFGASITIFSISSVYLWFSLRRFSYAGIVGADRSIRDGIDYSQALALANNSLSFLGTGSAKLTLNSELELSEDFAAAANRCNRSDRPIRFLLVHPDDLLLETAAKRFGKDDSRSYANKVRASLRVLSRLERERMFNIQVRFYSPNDPKIEFSHFRLMFINDEICLVSYTVYGRGDGSQLPQLIISNTRSDDDTKNFYYPFKSYYERLWNEATPWNPNEFV